MPHGIENARRRDVLFRKILSVEGDLRQLAPGDHYRSRLSGGVFADRRPVARVVTWSVAHFVVGVVVPIEAIILMVWWLWSAAQDNPDWLKVFSSYSVGTVIVQWAIGLTALIVYNRWRMRRREAS